MKPHRHASTRHGPSPPRTPYGKLHPLALSPYPYLKRLSATPVPLLGEIARAFVSDRRALGETAAADDLELLAVAYDSEYSARPDYWLWRHDVQGQIPFRLPLALFFEGSTADWWDKLRDGIATDMPAEVRWGTLQAFVTWAGRNWSRAVHGMKVAIRQATDLAWGQLAPGNSQVLKPLAAAPIQSAIVSVQTFAMSYRVAVQSGIPTQLEACFGWLQQMLCAIDPQYDSHGQAVDFAPLLAEMKRGPRVAPDSLLHAAFALQNALSIVGGLPQHDPTSASLEARKKLLWTVWASMRRAFNAGVYSAMTDVDDVFRDEARRRLSATAGMEWKALVTAGYASLDARDYSQAALLFQSAMECAPDDDDPATSLATLGLQRNVLRRVREIGLSIPEHFAKDYERNKRIDRRQAPLPVEDLNNEQMWSDRMEGWRVARDAVSDPRWRIVRDYLSGDGLELLTEHLRKQLKKERQSLHVLVKFGHLWVKEIKAELPAGFGRPAIELLLEFGYFKSALRLSEYLTPMDRPLVAQLVIHMRQNIANAASGMESRYLKQFQDLLRKAWAKLVPADARETSDGLSAATRFGLHECLNGLQPQLSANLAAKAQDFIFRSRHGLLAVDDRARFYRHKADWAYRRPPVQLDDVQPVISAASSAYGAGICAASICTASANRTSLVAVGPTAAPIAELLAPPPGAVGDIMEDVDWVASTWESWFQGPDAGPVNQVVWPDSLKAWAGQILSTVVERWPGVECLLLALPARIAVLPLQHLFGVAARDLNRAPPMIAVIPNLSWCSDLLVTGGSAGPVVARISQEPDLREPAGAIRAALARSASDRSGFLIAFGHGEHDDLRGAFIRLSQQEMLDRNRILDALSSGTVRTMLLGGCRAGHAQPCLFGDLGGLVGAALALGVDAVLAPVGAPRERCVTNLALKLLAAAPGTSFAAAYRDALAADAEVSLITIFGNPFAPIGVRLPESQMLTEAA